MNLRIENAITQDMDPNSSTVSIVKCRVEASGNDLEESVRKSIELSQAMKKLDFEGKRVLIKPNAGGLKLDRYKGWLVYLSDPRIAETVVKMSLERGCGDIVVADNPAIPGVNVPASFWRQPLSRDAKGIVNSFEDLYRVLGYDRFREKFGARVLSIQDGPYVKMLVPGGGLASKWYRFNHELKDIDIVVSICKMKNHASAGVTLTMKNLFGLCPYPRAHYAHYDYRPILRFPYFLIDLARLFKPRICIVDGIIASEGSEWFGTPKDVEVIIAGANPVSVDSIGMRVMGYDPMVDMLSWSIPNYIRLASEHGVGVVDPERIKTVGEPVESVKKDFVGLFEAEQKGAITPEKWIKFMKKQMEQVEFYNKNKDEFIASYLGKTIFLHDRHVEIETPGNKPAQVMRKAERRLGLKAFEGIVRIVKKNDPQIV